MTDQVATAVHADDWETLVCYVIRTIVTLGAMGGMGLIKIRAVPGAPALAIEMPCCGEIRSWQKTYQIPVNDVGPCRCGNWFIRYRHQPLQVKS